MSIGRVLVSIFNFVGGLVCHQLPERTLQMGGEPLCVCARDTGFYIGFIIGLLLLRVRRRVPSGPPNLYVTLGLMLPMLVDGATQAMGLRTSGNSLRLLTGLFFGTALSPFLLYLLSVLPTARRIPIIGRILPEEVRMDDPTSWIPMRIFLVGCVADLVAFLLILSLVGSTNRIFFWTVSFPLMGSLFFVIFVIPLVVLFSLISSIRGGSHGR